MERKRLISLLKIVAIVIIKIVSAMYDISILESIVDKYLDDMTYYDMYIEYLYGRLKSILSSMRRQ